MSLIVPWLIADADVALWPAWTDGMPFHGPGEGRDRPAPLLNCKSSLSISETIQEGVPTGHGWTGSEMARGSEFQITIEFPDGAMGDEWGRILSRMHHGGYRILTIRYFDEVSGQWSLLSFFYVVPGGDNESESSQKMSRSVTLKSSWLQEEVGSSDLPGMEPVVKGEVDWVCGTQRIPALSYDPSTEEWTSQSRNETGDDSRYVTLTPISEDEGSDIILSYYVPRAEDAPVVGTMLPTARLRWQNAVALRIGNQDSEYHHGLTLVGIELQAAGIVEPLVKIPQNRMLDEPVLVFRYLRRIYATIGHGVLAVPSLTPNEDPPITHDYAFRLAVPGPANPETGQSGLVLLPNGAWLDGTVNAA